MGSPAGRNDGLGATDVDVAELLARADDADLRGTVDDRVTTGCSGRDGVHVADVGEDLLARERVGSVALERHDVVPSRRERRDRPAPEQARASRDEDPHQTRLGAAPPASTLPAQRPSRVRSTFELWRTSTGR